jgi:hypothetical protein
MILLNPPAAGHEKVQTGCDNTTNVLFQIANGLF